MRPAPLRFLALLCLAPVLHGCASHGGKTLTLSDQELLSLPTLTIGDPAPALSTSSWVRGEPITRWIPGRIYMLDFWATWCGPCIASLPRSAKLERELQGEGFTVIALATIDAACTESQITSVTRELAGSMPSRVAIDNGQATARAFRVASRDMTVPQAFIIDRTGRIAWIGHPVQAHSVVRQVLAGTWDLAAARAKREANAQQEAAASAINKALGTRPRPSADEELALWQQLRSLQPENRRWAPPSMADTTVVELLLKLGRTDEALRTAEEAASLWNEDAQTLATLAIQLATAAPARADQLASLALDRINTRAPANPVSDEWERFLAAGSQMRDAGTLEMLAAFHHSRGRNTEAITLATRALNENAIDDESWKNRIESAIKRYSLTAHSAAGP